MPKKKAVEEKKVEKPVEVSLELNEAMLLDITNELKELQENLDKSMRFKAAAKRARKSTTNLQKMFKAFRAASVAHWKNI